MHRRPVLRGAVLAVSVALAGCSGGDDGAAGTDGTDGGGGTTPESTPTETLPDSEVVELSGPPCEAVAGTTFRSNRKRDGGQGPGGTPARVDWQVRFEGGGYEYSHADVVESGSYSCFVEDGTATVEGESSGSDLTYSGSYDPDSGVLEWDGVRNRPVQAI